MFKDIPDDLLAIIGPVVRDHGLEIVEATSGRQGGDTHLQIVLDTPAGDGLVKLDDCARVSREIGAGLDASDLFSGAYTLEVCSPGVDRTLGREVDFSRVIGSEVALETRQALDGRRRFRGRLLAFDGREAQLEIRGDVFRIAFDDIATAQAFYAFDSPPRSQEANV
jgi:ribosome maturation factor RimP